MQQRKALKIILVMGIPTLLIYLVFTSLINELVKRDLQREAREMQYLAQVGQVPATYDDVDAFLNQEFQVGMTREQVIAKLDERFIYAFTAGSHRDKIHICDWIVFPQQPSCSRAELENRFDDPEGCSTVLYEFCYSYPDRRIERVKRPDS